MSKKHDKRTRIMLDYVKSHFNMKYMAITADLEEYENCKEEIAYLDNNLEPLKAYPDLRAIDEFSEVNAHIIGEAKTENDYIKRNLDAEIQMDVYINVLKTKMSPFLIYSVPSSIYSKVYKDIQRKLDIFKAKNVTFKVLYK